MCVLYCVFVFFAVLSGVYGQEADNTPNKSVIVNDVLNDFESAEDWRAFSTSPLGDTKVQTKLQLGKMVDVYAPSNLTTAEKQLFQEGKNHVLGIKTYFKDRGFDRVEIRPPHEYRVEGIGKEVSIWVLGRNYRHTLYFKFRNYAGKIYKLRAGRLNFFGWRKLTVTLPGWLSQDARFSLFDKNLRFVSMFVESDKREVGGPFYFYVDHLTMKVDRTKSSYPGSKIRDLW